MATLRSPFFLYHQRQFQPVVAITNAALSSSSQNTATCATQAHFPLLYVLSARFMGMLPQEGR